MKKLIRCLFAALLLFTAVGCSTNTTTNEPEGTKLTVATFNIDAKSQPDVVAQSKLMSEHEVDIVGLQEVDNKTKRNNYDVVEKFLNDTFKDGYFTNCIGFQGGGYGIATISMHKFTDTSETKLFSDLFKGKELAEELKVAYMNHDPEKPETDVALDAVSEKGPVEPRCFQRVVFEKDGKQIAFYNTHLSYEDMNLRKKQMETLKAAMDKDTCDYVIAVGDFNADQSTKEFDLFKEDYNLSNGKDGKWLDTYNGEDDTMKVNSVDNVIVTKNISIDKVEMLNSGLSDHNPLVVNLTIEE